MDDLVKQARELCIHTPLSKPMIMKLADRIEELEANNNLKADFIDATINQLEAAEQRGYASAMEAERKLHEDRIKKLEANLAKVTTELKMLIDVSTLMQSSAFYDKRKYQSAITDTVWQQWSKQLKFSKGTIAELKGQKNE